MLLVGLYICLDNLPFSGLPDWVPKSVLGHCHSSLGIKVPMEFVKSHPRPNSLLQSRICSECEGLAARPEGRAQGWDVEGTEKRGKDVVWGAAPPTPAGGGVLSWEGALKAERPKSKRQPPAPPSLLPHLIPSHTPGEPAEGSSACRQRRAAPKSGDGGGEGVRGSDADAVRRHPPNLHPRKMRREELHFPAWSATKRPAAPPFPGGPRPSPRCPRRRAPRMRTASQRHVGSV